MKILHTADWHIGLKAAHLGDARSRVRNERFRAARRVVDAANAHGVDIMILAGDTFDDHNVGSAAVREVISILEQSDAPVYIIPGNHDYLCTGSVWEFDGWSRSGKIHLLTDEEPVDIGDAILYPCPVREYNSSDDPTVWIPGCDGSSSGKIRVAIVHGSVEGLPKDDLDLPVARALPESKGLDYVALGHWHSFSLVDAGGPCRMAYSGTHETNKFGKPDSRCAAVVTIDGPKAPPVIEKINTGGLTWIDRRERIDGRESIAAVAESILAIDEKELTLVKLELYGIYNIDDVGALNDLRAIGDSGQFLYFEVRLDDLHPVYGDIGTNVAWLNDIGETLVRKAGERIIGYDISDQSIRERALIELFSLSKDASR